MKRKLTPAASNWLSRSIADKEIKVAVFQLGTDKAPSPDDFNAGFYQKKWSLVGKEVTFAIKSLFQSGKLIKEVNHTFLSLVLKLLVQLILLIIDPSLVVMYYIKSL